MGGGLILLYHRVAPPGCDPFGLRVAPARFREHLAVLRDLGNPLPLPELVRRARDGSLPPRSVALTFDDGSPDLLEHALPALQEAAVPATLFVATARARRDYWWEELASLLLRPGELPRTLRLRWGACRQSWDLGEDAHWSAAEAASHASWRAFSGQPPTRRHAAYEQLWGILRPLPPRTRARLMARLRAWAGAPERRRAARARPLTRAELRRLADSGIVRLGGHTRQHPLLASVPEAEQRREIEGSRQDLQPLVGEVESFAYPFGGSDSYSRATVRLVREAGYRLACSTCPGHVQRSTDPLRLPRLAVGDWSGEDFTRWFTAWMS